MSPRPSRLPFLLALLLVAVKTTALVLDPESLSRRLLPNLWLLALVVLLLRAAPQPARGTWRRLRRGGLYTLASLAILHIGAVAWADHQLAGRDLSHLFHDPHKVWAARGLVLSSPKIVQNGEQNSIESIGRAFNRGARGCEVDVYWDIPEQRFIVSHNLPYHLKDGRLLPLEELFAAVGDRGWFWLDWKALRHLERPQLDAALDDLERMAAGTDLLDRVLIEGEAPFHIGHVRDRGFLTLLDAHPLRDANPLTPLIGDLYKLLYFFGDHSVIAMNAGGFEDPIYGPEMRRCLRHLPILLYHVPDDRARLRQLLADPQVRAFLVVDHSADRYQLVGTTAPPLPAQR